METSSRIRHFLKHLLSHLFQSQQNGATKNGVQTNGKSRTGICFVGQNGLYEQTNGTSKQMTNGYTSTESKDTLRNRVYIANGLKE